MKLKLCCFTCLICEDAEDTNSQAEDKPLIISEKSETEKNLKSPEKVVKRAPSRFLSSSTVGSSSDASLDHPDATEKFQKSVGILRRYNLTSKRYTDKKEIQRQLTSVSLLRVKISVKIMPRSDLVKIFVIEATNVMSILKIHDFPEAGGSSDSESAPIMQIRSKLIPSEIRGHTRKYEINDGITGAMKFRNECLHSLTVDEFLKCSLRVRVYYVLKHHRDKLLGEYTLEIKQLDISMETGTTNIIMETYDPMDTTAVINSPEIIPVNHHLFSVDSQSSISSTSSRKISRQTALESQDSVTGKIKLKSIDMSEAGSSEEAQSTQSEDQEGGGSKPNRPIAKAFKSIRHSASHILKTDVKEKLTPSSSR